MGPPQAVLLDAGGVLTLPAPAVVGHALDAAGIPHDVLRLEVAHYHGVAALDASSPGGWGRRAPEAYVSGWLDGLRVPVDHHHAGRRALHEVLSGPSMRVWSAVTPWARTGLTALAGTGLPLAVVSNSDGSVADQLRALGLCQVGPGPGTPVAAIVDSAVVGVAKPDPAVFAPALDTLGLPPDACWYVGDTVTYDVAGARSAGLVPVHLDPFSACGAADHRHVADLLEVVAQLERAAHDA